MSNLATLRPLVRLDLKDPTGASERWADAVLDRHIKRAVREYSYVVPRDQVSLLAGAAGGRTVGIGSLGDLIVRIAAVEFPIDRTPRRMVPFSVFGTSIYVDMEETFAGAASECRVWYHDAHVINGTVSFKARDDDVIVTGAAAFALLEYVAYVSNRVNVAGEAAWGQFGDLGRQKLETFRRMLRELPEANKVRSGVLFSPEVDVRTSQTSDPGPV